MALKDIMNNSSYGDDMVIEITNSKGEKQSATLGEIRADRALVEQQRNDLNTAGSNLYRKVESLIASGLIDAKTLDPIQRNDRKIVETVSSMTGMDENDPIFGQVVKSFKAELKALSDEIKSGLEGMKNDQKALANATRTAIGSYLDDTYRAQFNSAVAQLPEEVRGKVKLEDVMDFANKRNFKDQAGRLDIMGAVDRMTWDDVKKVDQKKLSGESDRIKADKDALAAMQRPGVSQYGTNIHKERDGFNPLTKEGKPKSIDEVLAEAANDSSIWDTAAQAAAGVVN